jgi:hypothetical protein
MEPEQGEVPLVVGSNNTRNLADANTMHGPRIASALHHITGETEFITVSGANSAKFCSLISVPIDANVSIHFQY